MHHRRSVSGKSRATRVKRELLQSLRVEGSGDARGEVEFKVARLCRHLRIRLPIIHLRLSDL